MKKLGGFFLISQLVGWALMTFADFLEETIDLDVDSIYSFLFFVLPCVMIVAYIFFERKTMYQVEDPDGGETVQRPWDLRGWKYKVAMKFLWAGIGFLFLVVFTLLSEYDLWIVPQDTVGWEHFLNGIEYYIFGFFFTGISLVGFVIYDVASALVRWMRLKKRETAVENK